MQEARETSMKHAKLYENAEVQISSMKEEISTKDKMFDDLRNQLEKALQDSEKKIGEVTEQNKILHDQIKGMGEKVDSIQLEKIAEDGNVDNGNEDSPIIITLKKQLKDLREVVGYMRSESEISATQLQSARLAAERERASSDIMKKSLEEARGELETLQKNLSSDSNANNLQIKLKESGDQLTLLRESNKLLREECEKVSNKVKVLLVEIDDAKNAVKPSNEKCRGLEVEKAALLADKSSLMREVDVWKDRVTSLVSQFHQVRFDSKCIGVF